MKSNSTLSALFLLAFSASSQAAILSFPIPVEYSASGTLDVIDPYDVHIGAVPVDFSPSTGDFGFTYLGVPGTGYDSEIYSAPGTYNFMSTPDSIFPSIPLSMTVAEGQLGMRTFVEWNSNIYDVLAVWDVTQTGNIFDLYATDMDGDGIRGYNMVSGPFAGYNFVMDMTVETPIPAAAWLFGSGVAGLIAVGRRKKAA